jgi:hypothetical protein
MVNPNRFYTYAYLREDRIPYYIGKGEGDRAYKKGKGEVNPPKDKSRVIFLKQNLTEEEAFKHEIYMIAVLGRKDLGTGILRNKTNGGEGASGLLHSEETKKIMSEIKKNKKYWNDGYGNLVRSIECPGEGWFSGMGKESKRSKVIIRTGKKSSCYSRLWWNDGKGNTKRSIECPGEGWVVGETEEHKRKLSEANKNKKWWNDGKGNTKRSIECPGEGWVLGRGERKETI